jgi:hypothetical protein
VNKKVIRYFGGLLETQEKWLNRMAAKGYRLVRTTRVLYEFERCQPSEYEYRVEFTADKPLKQIEEYRRFLKELGYRTFTKNINLNYSIGKVRWRPWATGFGQIATNPGSFNKELLIVERKRDGKPFEMHTDLEDIARYYQGLRNAHLFNGLLCGLALLINLFTHVPVAVNIILTFFSVIYLIPAVFYAYTIHRVNDKRKTYE